MFIQMVKLLQYVLKMFNKKKIDFKNFTISEAQSATEAFITSATTFVTPVIKINNAKISDGNPGKFTKLLRKKYIEKIYCNQYIFKKYMLFC